MQFNQHLDLVGKHAPLSPSQNAWINYDDEKLVSRYRNSFAASIGTILHNTARKRIKYLKRLNKQEKNSVIIDLLESRDPFVPADVIYALDFNPMYENLMNYTNDAIGFKMSPEVILYYSDRCFGTSDAVSFNNDILRIHDLKTGLTPAHMTQLELYAALFCLEYDIRPQQIGMELRIYQVGDVITEEPDPDQISFLMDKIRYSDRILKGE